MEKLRAYKYRFYPTEDQKDILSKTFGCVRYVYNWGLHLSMSLYRERGERLYYSALSSKLTLLKKQHETVWLNDVSSVVLQQSLRHLDRAFINFFEGRAEHPKFHKKTSTQSATYTSSAFRWNGSSITLAKMVEPLNIRWTLGKKNRFGKRERYLFSGVPSTVTVSKDRADRFFISFHVREEVHQSPNVNHNVGIDLGLTHAVILSSGEKFENPRFLHKEEQRLIKAQRALSKKQKGSRNEVKARRKLARLHARVLDRRTDFLHKLTTEIVNENQVISVESLKIKNMLRNPRFAQNIADVSWGELLRQLEYKSDWKGRTLVQIDRFYPSSKLCSTVGCTYRKDDMHLSTRSWTCPTCGVTHDRDINAAKNILAAGQAVLACGEAVRPNQKRRRRREGKSFVKQEA